LVAIYVQILIGEPYFLLIFVYAILSEFCFISMYISMLVGNWNLTFLLFFFLQLLNATDGEKYSQSWECSVRRTDHLWYLQLKHIGWNFWWHALVISVAILYALDTDLGSG